jgi:hypothetical protein
MPNRKLRWFVNEKGAVWCMDPESGQTLVHSFGSHPDDGRWSMSPKEGPSESISEERAKQWLQAHDMEWQEPGQILVSLCRS